MTSPEYLTMVRCTSELTDTLAEDPKRVGESLFAAGFIAPGIRDDMQMDMMRPRDKSSRLVSTMSDRIKNNPSVFHEFVDILKEQGSWTKDLVELLNTTHSSLIKPKDPEVSHRQPQVKPEMDSHSDHSLEEVDDEIDEDMLDSMLTKHKDLINNSRGDLCLKMDPAKVVMQLRKQGVFMQYDQQDILAKPTSLTQNDLILDVLLKRGPQAFDEFVQCLKSINPLHVDLAYSLQPVRYRILWFASSPTVAASVVYALEEYGRAKFIDCTSGNKYIVRRATIFQRVVNDDDEDELSADDDGVIIKDTSDVTFASEVEICLVFPVLQKDELVREAMSAAFEKVCPQADMAVMSGVCVGVRGGKAREGDVIIVDKATPPPSESLVNFKVAKDEILRIFSSPDNHPAWMRDLPSTHKITPRMPHFLTLSPPALESQQPKLACVDDPPSFLENDKDSFEFYHLCESRQVQGKPHFVCKGVVEGVNSDVVLSCSVFSSCVLMEVCRVFVERFRTVSE